MIFAVAASGEKCDVAIKDQEYVSVAGDQWLVFAGVGS
jgi:hypothetical protein